MKTRCFLFLYLDTGAGHLSPARILRAHFADEAYVSRKEQKEQTAYSVVLKNGFGPRQFISHSFFEDGYRLSCSLLPAAYSAFYELTSWNPALHTVKQLCSWRTVRYLEKIMRRCHVTDIVCFHFAVAPAAKRAADRVRRNLPFTVVITDPFTAHPAWFLVRSARFAVFSAQIKNEMHAKYKIGSGTDDCPQVKVFPFPVGRQFLAPPNEKERMLLQRRFKQKYGIPQKNAVVLMAGGGEGLPNIVRLADEFFRRMPPDMTVIAVCGRNKQSYIRLCRRKKKHPPADMRVFTYTNAMHELMHAADCVITKAGASMTMEAAACRKPVIFSAFIHGQELGNVEFCISAGIGWFFRHPRDIFGKALDLCFEPPLRTSVQKKYDEMDLRFDDKKLIDWLVNGGE
ncbi:MAG: hypothetical protein NC041_04885 [Bacteroides sp.]|nr:hypothetical protein [Prevotella sp.]MCM1407295.1 hypothetical protein [Treponema brennaborense]MCM1469783.1 hypothetical protein [Bacteroides sp.]